MAFKRWSKTPTKKGVSRSWNITELKIISWCLNNKIKIGVSPDWEGGIDDLFVDISINKKIHRDPNRYDSKTVLNKVMEYYKYYYDKYNVNTKQIR